MPENNYQASLGIHRVVKPALALPQQAEALRTDLPIEPSELLIDVTHLNVDSASFRQFYESSNGDLDLMSQKIMDVISSRGKLQNPVTGSGGMLIGTVREIGKEVNSPSLKDLNIGDRVATLVSLTLTPLSIKKIIKIIPEIERIEVEAYAIIFNSGMAVKLPENMPEGLALAALDVCGAPAQTAQLVQPDMNVAVIGGGGKSGLLSLYEAKKQASENGKVVAFEYSPEACKKLEGLSFVDEVIQGNAQDAVATATAIRNAFDGEGADLVINVTNVPHTEMSTILSTKNQGTAYFFSMATSFTAAALGAEGVSADVKLMIGNGFTSGHAAHTLSILEESEELLALFKQYAD